MHRVGGPQPVVFAIPDPRLHHNFAGASFTAITQALYSLLLKPQANEEFSWTEGFYRTDMEKLETRFMFKSILREKYSKKMKKDMANKIILAADERDKVQVQGDDAEQHKIVVLKTTLLTNYHFIQDHTFSIKPLYLKNYS